MDTKKTGVFRFFFTILSSIVFMIGGTFMDIHELDNLHIENE